MAESLRYYIAHNGGLKVMEKPGGFHATPSLNIFPA